MGLFSDVLAPIVKASYAPDDDFWFNKSGRFGLATNAGVTASPDAAMRLSTVYACVRLLADMVGYLPLHVYKRRADEGKDRATDHPVYPLLRRRPNQWQTAIRWRQQGMRQVLLRGNFYNLIVSSTRRVRELIPLDPDRMTVKLLDSGRRGYIYRGAATEPAMHLTQDEVFHVMGFSLDGVTGCSVIEYARESMGRALAEELYASRFWSQGGAIKGALVVDGKLTTEQRKANEEAWQQSQGGWMNAHKTALLEGGIKWQQIGISARDAQYIEGRDFSVADIARWFGIPPHMIGDVDKSTSWGTGIEQQSLGFLTTVLLPWLTLWEQETDRQLLDDDDEFFSEFLVAAMLKADLAARSTAYSSFIQGGIMTRNEVRLLENLNPLPGLDAPLTPLNMSPTRDMPSSREQVETLGGLIRAGFDPDAATKAVGMDPIDHLGLPPVTVQPENPAPDPFAPRPVDQSNNGDGTPPDEPKPDEANAVAHALVLRAATRVVRKEIAAIQKWAPRYASNPAGWREWVTDFYGKHVATLEDAIGLDQTRARQYGAAHTAALLEQGVAVLEAWDRHAPAALTALALGEASWDTASLAS